MVSLLLLCVLFTQTAFSQTKTVKGKVTDDKGLPIQGATVTVKGSKVGTSTDAAGSFSINVPDGSYALTVSSVGFSEQDVSVVNQTTVSVSLVSTSQSLNDVVVIGYGTAKRKDLTGAVSTVTAKDFNQGLIAAPDQLLTNKTPGVEITTGSGQPGVAPTIRIRGTNSILNTGNPLVVVDGVELDGRDATPALTLGGSIGFGTVVPSNPLMYINPYDIQSIDVLKDASASAIYGSRGASGVIVITTKKASSGPVKMEIGTSWGDNLGYMKTDDLMTASQFRSKLQEYGSQDTTLHTFDYGSSVNALKAVEQHTISQNYNLALSGGNENGKFRASFLGSNLEGLLKSTDLSKYIGTLSGTYKFFDKHFTLDFGLIVGHTDQQQPLITNTAGSQGQLMQWILQWNPTQPFYLPSGVLNNNPGSGQTNPIAALQAYSDMSHVTTVLANISGTVDILKSLSYKFTYSLNDGSGSRYTNAYGWVDNEQGISGVGVGVIGNANLNSQTITNVLNFHSDLSDKLRFEALLGEESWVTRYSDIAYQGTGFDINNTLATRVNIPNTSQLTDAATFVPTPADPSNPTVSIQSYFARAVFNWSDKYYLTGTFRADGSSKFGSNNRYGYFPSAAARWVISNENFMKGSVFSQLALRGSWGETGDQGFPAGAAQAQFTLPLNASIGQINVPNPNLKWQQTATTDIGLDYSFLNGRVYGAIDYYRKNTTQIIDQKNAIQPAPSGTEFINIPANLYNTGVEFYIGAAIVQHSDFTWNAAFNISYNKNLLKNFTQAPIQTGDVSGPGLSSTYAQEIANNHPLDVFYLPHYYGSNKAGGDSVSATSQYGADPNPHVQLGFSSNFTYKHFSLVVNFGGTYGYKVYNNTAIAVTSLYNFAKGFNTSLKAFTPNANVSAADVVLSDRYVENGSFLKLRNASLSYNFGDVGKYVHNLNVFVTGTNIFIITKYKGFDPEINVDHNNNNIPSRSMDYLSYPTPRILSAGLNVSL